MKGGNGGSKGGFGEDVQGLGGQTKVHDFDLRFLSIVKSNRKGREV
jgi:hypothetical protein